MRILSVTAGAAGMYCGSCLRDNALAIELMARGHDVTLVPVYTPTLTDDQNVSRRNVLFGGISVYLQQHSSIFRQLPRFFDRLWDSPWVINAFAGRGVSADARFLGEMTISMLQGEGGRAAQGVRQARGLDEGRAGPRRRQPAELAPHLDGGAAQARLESSGVRHAAGRRAVHQRTRAALSRAGAALDQDARSGMSTASSRSATTAPGS